MGRHGFGHGGGHRDGHRSGHRGGHGFGHRSEHGFGHGRATGLRSHGGGLSRILAGGGRLGLLGRLAGGEPGGPRRRVGPAIVIAAVAGWSFLAWLAYVVIEAALGWLGAGSGSLLEAGRGAVALAGGEEAAAVVDGLGADGAVTGLLGVVHALDLPVVFAVWALGAAAILVLPLLLGALRRASGRGAP